MATKPTAVPRWANVGGAIVEPSSGKKDVGWVTGERPPAQYNNWLANLAYQWADFLDKMTGATQSLHIATQILTAASGTYTPTTGTQKVRLRMVAGGGGGGFAGGSAGGNQAGGGGGGSGQYLDIWIDPAATITGGAFTRGAGGAGGIGGNGSDGTDSTIVIQGVTYTCKGGAFGLGANNSTGLAPRVFRGGGITGSPTGQLISGMSGGDGVLLANTGTAACVSGYGGSNPFGLGGTGVLATSDVNGNPGLGAGAGGGGAGANTATSRTGGAGSNGIIVIEEFR